ncbi:hypothetical protein BAE44_0021530 [Dichanthelium oligosanthes]|uniref:Protein SLOW GREEN 1, chloroplastic n=1 Tax=Dichanthelium oligosanthes TaxID=888268 RepID=A0A1E5UX67_9POAL|nr:hypothetical protein BAE44_0021530 [Dichanthelium oligosanthes]
MAMSFVLPATTPAASASLLPIRRQAAGGPSLSLPLKPHRFRIPPNPPCFSRVPSISPSCKTPTVSVLSSVASASSTLLFLLAAGLVSLSGVRPLPALASAPPPTQQPQIEGQEEQQESEYEQQESEDEQQESEDEQQESEDEQQQSEEKKQQAEDEVEKEEQQEDEEDDDDMRMYSAILSRNPGDVDALKCALYAKMRRADWGGALRYARRLRDAEPGEVEWRLMEAQLQELSGDLAEAERLFRELLAEEPLLVRALHVGIACLPDLGVFAHCNCSGSCGYIAQIMISDYDVIIGFCLPWVPEERNIKLLIAQMHVVVGQLDVASEKLEDLINEDPRDFRSHLCQGIVYALLDRKEDADKKFDIYRSLVPDEFPDKSFISDVILATKMESNDRIQKEFGSEFLSKK